MYEDILVLFFTLRLKFTRRYFLSRLSLLRDSEHIERRKTISLLGELLTLSTKYVAYTVKTKASVLENQTFDV